jgi:hypothetical protein
MVFEVKGKRPALPIETIKKQNFDRSLQIISQRTSLLPSGVNQVLDVPFVHQESGATCFWACCLAVQEALKLQFGDRYMYFDKTEAELTRKARTLGLLVEGGTNSLQPGLFPFLSEELGLNIVNSNGGAVEIIRTIFDDLQRKNVTMVNIPHELTGHWNVVRAIEKHDDAISFNLMDPIMGNRTVDAATFVSGLTQIRKDGTICSASSVSIEIPKPTFKIKSVRRPNQ